LTDAHVNPGSSQKMKERHASQIFSATVAAGIKICFCGGALHRTAETTITVIDHTDKLFDLLSLKKKFGGIGFN